MLTKDEILQSLKDRFSANKTNFRLSPVSFCVSDDGSHTQIAVPLTTEKTAYIGLLSLVFPQLVKNSPLSIIRPGFADAIIMQNQALANLINMDGGTYTVTDESMRWAEFTAISGNLTAATFVGYQINWD